MEKINLLSALNQNRKYIRILRKDEKIKFENFYYLRFFKGALNKCTDKEEIETVATNKELLKKKLIKGFTLYQIPFKKEDLDKNRKKFYLYKKLKNKMENEELKLLLLRAEEQDNGNFKITYFVEKGNELIGEKCELSENDFSNFAIKNNYKKLDETAIDDIINFGFDIDEYEIVD